MVEQADSRLKTLSLAGALFLLNVYVCRDLFGIEYLSRMDSIEGAFIGMSRYVMAHWRDLSWFPLWNGGTPFPTTYPPLLQLVVAFAAWARGVSPAHAYHWITPLAYCLGPVALYALTVRLSGSRWAGFVAGLIYSCVSTSYWILPAVGRDLGNPFFSRRLQALVTYGEGPHVSSMTLLTLALLCLDIAIARRSAPYISLAAVALAATALTNWLGAFAIVLIVAPYVLAHIGRGGWSRRELATLVVIGAAAYGLAMPLMPPSTIATLQMNAETTGGNYVSTYQSGLPHLLEVVAGLLAVRVVTRRRPRYLQFGILFAFLMTLVVTADGLRNIAIVPMAIRYHLEMEMSLAMLAAFWVHAWWRTWSANRPAGVAGVAVAALGVLVIALIHPIRMQRGHARELIQPIDITQTIEWKSAQWLNRNWTGERVMLAGSIGFWLNTFGDTPQLWGFEQATTNFTNRTAIFVIYKGDPTGLHETDSAVLWMKALGVHAVEVSGPSSTESYKPFAKPQRFEGVLDPLWRNGDNVLYRVGDHAGLARIVPRGSLVSHPPVHGLDLDPLRPYVAALDDLRMPRADFRWKSAHSARIVAGMEPGQVVSIQAAWHNGWRATVNGHAAPVQRDALGQMYIDPHASGPVVIEMIYDGGLETRLAHWIFALTALALIAASVGAFEDFGRSRRLPRF